MATRRLHVLRVQLGLEEVCHGNTRYFVYKIPIIAVEIKISMR